jgi:hypothetical protein
MIGSKKSEDVSASHRDLEKAKIGVIELHLSKSGLHL